MAVDTSCLYSTVKNVSGTARYFDFLPPHGKRLEIDEEFTVFGDIRHAVINDVERVTSLRNMQAFERALENDEITIISTPAPMLLDITTGDTKMLSLDNGTLGDVDPCWTTSASEDLIPV